MRAVGSYMDGKKGATSVNRHSVLRVGASTTSILKSAGELAGQPSQQQPYHNAYLNMPEIASKPGAKDRFATNNSAMERTNTYH